MPFSVDPQATEEEVAAAKAAANKPSAKAKPSPPKKILAATKKAAVPKVPEVPLAETSPVKVSPNPAPHKRIKGKQPEALDPQKQIQELMEAVA